MCKVSCVMIRPAASERKWWIKEKTRKESIKTDAKLSVCGAVCAPISHGNITWRFAYIIFLPLKFDSNMNWIATTSYEQHALIGYEWTGKNIDLLSAESIQQKSSARTHTKHRIFIFQKLRSVITISFLLFLIFTFHNTLVFRCIRRGDVFPFRITKNNYWR